MEKSFFKIGIVVIMFVLLIGMSIVPLTSGNITNLKKASYKIISKKNSYHSEFIVTPPEEEWDKTFGGTNGDDGNSVQQTTDGGYVIVGSTNSFGPGGSDVWLIKTDSNGDEQWNKTFGGIEGDWGNYGQQTTDGGYIIAGRSESYGNDDSNSWLIKTDDNGNEQWNKTFEGYANSVQQTTDGGYILVGTSWIFVDTNLLLTKTDDSGNQQWNKTFYGTGFDYGQSVQQTTDGGYVIGGRTTGPGNDFWLIKTDANGNEQWNKSYSRFNGDWLFSAKQTADGGYIMIGESQSKDADVLYVWLIKTDENGNEQWNKIYGSGDDDYFDRGRSANQTADGGYIITGETESYGAGVRDVWLIKTDDMGNEIWNQTYGGTKGDWGNYVQQTTDGGYIIVGGTKSFGAGDSDVWLIKVASGENQFLSWQWAKQAGGTSWDMSSSIEIDDNGNLYITGYFSETAYFGSNKLTSNGEFDVFIAKMDETGNWLWVKQAGGTSWDLSSSIEIDDDGNLYITGSFGGTATFGPFTLVSSGSNDVFVAKLDTNGNWLWAKQAGGSEEDYCDDISAYADGNLYITGYFRDTATFGSFTLVSSGYIDIFVAKLDASGNWLWAKRAGGSSGELSSGIDLDTDGNLYITGDFNGTATFGSFTLVSSGGSDVFVTKLDMNGNWLWAKQAGGTNILSDCGLDIYIDINGDSYVTGIFYGPANFGSFMLTGYGSTDVFIAKLDTNGNWLWAKQAGGSEDEESYSICQDFNGNLYITGRFEDTIHFGSFTSSSIGEFDVFVAKMDAMGNWLWAKQAGGNAWDSGTYIDIDPHGNLFITGIFEGISTFGNTILTSNGESDIFIAKLGDNHPPTATTITGQTNGKTGTEYEYTFKATDPDGDNVKYYINWGDNNSEWTEYSDSGVEITLKYAWSEEGTYKITAKAQDINGAEGPENTLTIIIPRTRTAYHQLILQLFERFPNVFPILRQLLGF